MKMERTQVEAAVTDLVRSVVGLPDGHPIRLDAGFKTDLGTDSLTDAELGMEIEDRFEIEVPDGVRPQNIREVVDLILDTKKRGS